MHKSEVSANLAAIVGDCAELLQKGGGPRIMWIFQSAGGKKAYLKLTYTHKTAPSYGVTIIEHVVNISIRGHIDVNNFAFGATYWFIVLIRPRNSK